MDRSGGGSGALRFCTQLGRLVSDWSRRVHTRGSLGPEAHAPRGAGAVPPAVLAAPGVLALLAVVAALAAGALPGCRRTGATADSADAEVRTLRLGYFANLTHAQAVLGVASGDFARAVAPAALETRVFNAGPSLIEALFSGEIDIGYIGPSPVLNAHARSRGRGVRVIAGAAANGVCIVARRGSGITHMADLRGRLIASPQLGNTQDVSARHYMISVLKQPDANNVIAIPNSEQLAMMKRGHIDAAWSPEPWAARLVIEADGVLLAEEKDLWPGGEFTLALVVTTPRFLAEHPDRVRAVLTVHREWTRRLSSEPLRWQPELSAALLALTGKSIPPAAFAQALTRVRFTTEPLEDSIAAFAAWGCEIGMTREAPDLTALIDTTILHALPP